MKRFLAVILSLVTVLCLVSCVSQTKEKSNNNKNNTSKNDILVNDDETSNDNDEQYKHTGKKIEGDIVAASVFSEGLAFVSIGDKKTYCINKSGYIVFELEMELAQISPASIRKIDEFFLNGIAILNLKAQEGTPRMICDTKGNITKCEDIGINDVSGIALKDGYLIVEKVTASYDSSKKEIGVMDTDFNWIIEPSEEIYDKLVGAEDYYTFKKITRYYGDYLGDDILAIDEILFNLKTGEISKIDTVDDLNNIKIPSDFWQLTSADGMAFRYNYSNIGKIMLDLKDIKNVRIIYETKFTKGKSPLAFYNEESETYFFTVINEKGEFLFQPIEFKEIKEMRFSFDGEYLLVKGNKRDDNLYPTVFLKCYDTKGNLLGEKTYNSIFEYRDSWISDGVINIQQVFNCTHYNPDFTELF